MLRPDVLPRVLKLLWEKLERVEIQDKWTLSWHKEPKGSSFSGGWDART